MALKDDYGRAIELLCPTCGASQFEYDDDIEAPAARVQCAHCARGLGKDELVEWNQERIHGHADDISQEIARDVKREFRERLKKMARGSRNIRFK